MTNHMPNVRDLLSSLRKEGWYITAFELHYNKHDYVVVFEDAAHLNKNKQYFSAALTFYDIHDPNRILSDVYANTSKLDIPLSTFYNFFDIDASNRSYNSGDVIFSFYSTLNSKMPGTFNLAAQNAHQKEILSTIERREPSDGMCCYSAQKSVRYSIPQKQNYSDHLYMRKLEKSIQKSVFVIEKTMNSTTLRLFAS